MNRATFIRFLFAQLGVALAAGGRASQSVASEGGPKIIARAKPLLDIDGFQFKDLNGNGKLDPYEDWRLPVQLRVEDLLKRMTLAEKAGMLLIDTANADVGGTISAAVSRYVTVERMTRFVFRNPVVPNPVATSGEAAERSGAQVTPRQAAMFTNAVQELAERTSLGIPVVFKSNARNHYEEDARFGISEAAGSFSEWPKEAGLAALQDMNVIREFGSMVAQEWCAVGLRGMYGYMADLATEPRWFRVHETFTEDPELAARIMAALVPALQMPKLGPGGVALTIKHFPGGGTVEGGRDPHYSYGKRQVYPSNAFELHLKPFKAAIDAGASAIMTYYGIPVGQPYLPNDVGMAFSKGIVTDLLRGALGFKGYVNSDTGIIGTRAWGLESRSQNEQIAIAINAGTDVLSGFHDNEQMLSLVSAGQISEARLDQSVRRLLTEQFALGLFENPYVDAEAADRIVGNELVRKAAQSAQRRSIVLLRNQAPTRGAATLLPLNPVRKDGSPTRVYVLGVDPEVARRLGFVVTDGMAASGTPHTRVPEGTDAAIIRVSVTNPVMPVEGQNPPRTLFGGAIPAEIDLISFSAMARARSWRISPSLDEIQSVMNAVGKAKVVLAIYFRQPYVLDDASELQSAGALLAIFGVSDVALMDVIAGHAKPQGRLPFSLAKSLDAIKRQPGDLPGYPPGDLRYPFGYGLSY